MSFGGILGGGTTIFSKRYKLSIYKDYKTKEWKQKIKKKRLPIVLHFMFLFFPLFDGLFYIIEFKSYWITNTVIAIGKFIFGDITKSEAIDIMQPVISVPSWVWDVIVYGLIGFLLIFLYYFWLRGIRKWHGCEHKVIAAAEKDDINNAISYDPVNDKCGGTYMLSIYFGMGFYWFLSTRVFLLSIPVGVFTFVLFIMIIESRLFHKYNKIGIWFGRWLQRKITIDEPFDWQLNLGIDGMKKLIDCEYNNKNPGELV